MGKKCKQAIEEEDDVEMEGGEEKEERQPKK